jgi:hypothetical protein
MNLYTSSRIHPFSSVCTNTTISRALDLMTRLVMGLFLFSVTRFVGNEQDRSGVIVMTH